MKEDGPVHPSGQTRLVALADIPDGTAREVEAVVDGIAESVIVVREGQRACAYLNVCPHAGHRLDWSPGHFLFDQGRLVCAVHGACFERMTGLCVAGPCRGSSLRSVAVSESEGWVVLDPPVRTSG